MGKTNTGGEQLKTVVICDVCNGSGNREQVECFQCHGDGLMIRETVLRQLRHGELNNVVELLKNSIAEKE
jgi:DnaJ-class molecular chaperone